MEQKRLKITEWAEEDRPREKLMHKGIASLSDAELIAILIGTGNAQETAVELSRRILKHSNDNLNELGKYTINDLVTNFKGIGEAKAITIIAALELGRRRKHAQSLERKKINSSLHAFEIIHPILSDLNHEEFWMLLLNRGNKVIEPIRISQGGLSSTTVDTRLVLKIALDKLASSVVLCHNHPSGNKKASPEDISLTCKLNAAFKAVEISVLDHIIIAGNTYFSFMDEGLLN